MHESRENSRQVAEMLLRLFGYWRLPINQQLTIMGLYDCEVVDFSKHLKCSLYDDRDKLERANILLGIHKSLRVLFPQNWDLAHRWISQPNKAFDRFPPLKVIERHGMLGMYIVRDHLDQHGVMEGLTIETLIEGSPDIKMNRSEQEWLDEVPAGRELPERDINFKNEEICAMLDILTTVLQVFGNEKKAKLWVETIAPALGCAPMALLCSGHGREKILDALRADFG